MRLLVREAIARRRLICATYLRRDVPDWKMSMRGFPIFSTEEGLHIEVTPEKLGEPPRVDGLPWSQIVRVEAI